MKMMCGGWESMITELAKEELKLKGELEGVDDISPKGSWKRAKGKAKKTDN